MDLIVPASPRLKDIIKNASDNARKNTFIALTFIAYNLLLHSIFRNINLNFKDISAKFIYQCFKNK